MFRRHTSHYSINERKWMTIRFEQQPKSAQCPSGVRFAVMGFVDEEEVIRIDNSPHHGIARTHIHINGKVTFLEFASQAQACDYVEQHLRRYHD